MPATAADTRGVPAKSTATKGITTRAVTRTWRNAAVAYSITAAKSGTRGARANACIWAAAESVSTANTIRSGIAAAELACTTAAIHSRVADGAI